MTLRKVKFFENDYIKVCPGESEEKFVVEFKEKVGCAIGIIQGLPFAFRECGIRWGDKIIIEMLTRDSKTWFDNREISFSVTLTNGGALTSKFQRKFEKLKIDTKLNVQLMHKFVTIERTHSFATICKDVLPNQEAEACRLRSLKYVFGDNDYLRLAESDSSDDDEYVCKNDDEYE